MKLLLIFLVFFFFALVQETAARPYPEDSSPSPSSWYSWLIPRSSSYNSDISQESTDLLKQGSNLANQVLDLAAYVPGLQTLFEYGKRGIQKAEDLGKTTVQAINRFQEQNNNLTNILAKTGTIVLSSFASSGFGLGFYFPLIASRANTMKSDIVTVLTIMEHVVDRIGNFSSVGDTILTSLYLTKENINSARGTVTKYLP